MIDTIEAWQKKIYPVHGVHFIHASDEWYLLANRPLPAEERYDGYLQLENGVGMLRLLYEEVKAEVETMEMDASRHRVLSLATGRLAAPYMEKLGAMIREKLPNLTLQVYEIRNDFFGERITVSGLITARDLIAQLKGQDSAKSCFFRAICCAVVRMYFWMISLWRMWKRLYKRNFVL